MRGEARATAEGGAGAAGGDPELRWLREVYRPGARQLTARAAVAGGLIGVVMCLVNLYIVLKSGFSVGVTVTACALAYGAFGLLRKAGLVRERLEPLENSAVGSVASAAGYMAGGGNMAALPALMMLTGERPGAFALALWLAAIAGLGVVVAVPFKRQLINVEQVPFPSGVAAAETIRALHGRDGGGRAAWLGGAAAASALVALFRDARFLGGHNLPGKLKAPFELAGRPLADWSLSFDVSFLFVAIGGMVSFRTAWSFLLGGALTYGALAPALVAGGAVAEANYKAIVGWTVWPGAALLVSSGVLSFAFQWRAVARSFRGLAGARRGPADDPMAGVECPLAWFVIGFAAFGALVVFLARRLFGIPVWAGLISLPLALITGMIAARVTGETDLTPTKALGPLTQMIYGALLPRQVVANVMSANITGGVGLHAADLLTDLRCGHLLGAKPRQQFLAQLFGVVAGAAAVVPAFYLIVPDRSALGTEEFPAPAVQVWANVSQLLAYGLGALPPSARAAALGGLALGAALATAERFAPERWQRFVPSPSGLGMAMVIPAYQSLSLFVGGALALALRARRPRLAERALVPLTSGLIAGEGLLGVLVAMVHALNLDRWLAGAFARLFG